MRERATRKHQAPPPVPKQLAERLVKGEITLGEFLGLSQEKLYEIAASAYRLLDSGQKEAVRTALALYKGLVHMSPYDSVFHCHLAACFVAVKKLDDAREHYDAALRLNKSNVDALVGRAEVHLHQGRAEEGLADLGAALALDPEATRKSTQRARVLLKMLKDQADAVRKKAAARGARSG